MKTKKLICLVMSIILFGLSTGTQISAAEPQSMDGVTATNPFSLTVSGKAYAKDTTAISFDAGEKVTIKGSFSPYAASVRYGFMNSEGIFYGVSAKDGILDHTFSIGKSGSYYFTIVNDSSVPVSVTGYINY